MGSKLGFILSLLFLANLFALVGDLMSIEFIHSNIESLSVSVAYLISKSGAIKEDAITMVEDAGAYIVEIGNSKPQIGELVKYKIYKQYKPLILTNDLMEIAVVRSVMVGYFN